MITLFSSHAFQWCRYHLKNGRKNGDIKVHAVILGNEGGPSEIRFATTSINYSIMPKTGILGKGDRDAIKQMKQNFLFFYQAKIKFA